jgi:hypothetical protein
MLTTHNVPSVEAAPVLSRLGGAHHGCPSPGGRLSARLTGIRKSHPQYGTDRVNSTVWVTRAAPSASSDPSAVCTSTLRL